MIKMKLAFLAARSSIHTVRWVNALAERGHEVYLLSIQKGGDTLDERVKVHYLPIAAPAGYYFNAWTVKKLLSTLKPDILHAHYASGYGTLGRLSGFHPYILSVWGSDVYDFPLKSPVHRKIIVRNLRAADWLCSTSHVMKDQTLSLFPTPNISVIPFGIDTRKFNKISDQRPDKEEIVVGTVKTLAPKYGIDVLIRAFALARESMIKGNYKDAAKLRLLIVGGGPDETKLKNLARELNIADITTFCGRVPHEEVPKYLNSMDIYVAVSVSESESFGVAIIEASACGLPVIVSDVGGLPEVVVANKTGLIVRREDVSGTAEAIIKLVRDRDLREQMGLNGRLHVQENYEWSKNVSQMEEVYARVIRMKR